MLAVCHFVLLPIELWMAAYQLEVLVAASFQRAGVGFAFAGRVSPKFPL